MGLRRRITKLDIVRRKRNQQPVALALPGPLARLVPRVAESLEMDRFSLGLESALVRGPRSPAILI